MDTPVDGEVKGRKERKHLSHGEGARQITSFFRHSSSSTSPSGPGASLSAGFFWSFVLSFLPLCFLPLNRLSGKLTFAATTAESKVGEGAGRSEPSERRAEGRMRKRAGGKQGGPAKVWKVRWPNGQSACRSLSAS